MRAEYVIAVTLIPFLADLVAQAPLPPTLPPVGDLGSLTAWGTYLLEYGIIGVMAIIFYRLWAVSQKRQAALTDERIDQLEQERDEARQRADKARDDLLEEVRTNREQYRDFLRPYLTVDPSLTDKDKLGETS